MRQEIENSTKSVSCSIRALDSDSVSPGSNPGSPASLFKHLADSITAESTESAEQTADIGRTRVGTPPIPLSIRPDCKMERT